MEQRGSQPGGPNPPARGSHLVASSAPFPNAQQQQSSPATTGSREQSLAPDHESEAAGPSSVPSDDASSVAADMDATAVPQLSGFDMSQSMPNMSTYGYAGTSPSNGTVSDAADLDFTAVTTDDEDTNNDYFINTHGPSTQSQQLFGFDASETLPQIQTAHSDTGALASPPAIDMASTRRHRRPAPLSIGGVPIARSSSFGVPRTAVDMGMGFKRGDMLGRRHMSTSRIHKLSNSSATPRTFPMSRSPASAGGLRRATPPTPETPMPDGIMTTAAGTTAAQTMFLESDPTLRTPPTTPGNTLRNGSVYGITPSSNVFDMSMVMGASSSSMMGYPPSSVAATPMVNYMTSSMSQPQTPSFVSPIGTSPLSGTEYSWAGGMIPESLSPGEDQQLHAQSHFYGMGVPAFMET